MNQKLSHRAEHRSKIQWREISVTDYNWHIERHERWYGQQFDSLTSDKQAELVHSVMDQAAAGFCLAGLARGTSRRLYRQMIFQTLEDLGIRSETIGRAGA